MSTPLPELPSFKHCMTIEGWPKPVEVYTPNEVRAYGLAVWKAAMERAAEVAEETIVAEYEGVDCYGDKAADAIRSLPLPESDMTQARGE